MPIPDMPRSSLDTPVMILDTPRSIRDTQVTILDMPHSSPDIMPVPSSGLPATTDKNGGR